MSAQVHVASKLEHWQGLTPDERKERRRHPQTQADHEARLEEGWVWLKKHPNRRDFEDKFEVWLGWLREYQTFMDRVQQGSLL